MSIGSDLSPPDQLISNFIQCESRSYLCSMAPLCVFLQDVHLHLAHSHGRIHVKEKLFFGCPISA